MSQRDDKNPPPRPLAGMAGRRLENPSRRVAALLAALFVAAFAALALVVPFEPVPRAQVTQLFSKNAVTHLLPIVATFWGISAFFRCSDGVIKRYIAFVATTIVLWSVVSMAKHMTWDTHLESLLWYAYYIPITLVPTFILFCALHVAVPDDRPAAMALKGFCLGVSVILSLLVLTNNLHHLAFDFSFDDESWRQRHGYGPVYFAVFVWIALQGACFVGLLFAASRRQLRNALAVVVGVTLLGMGYSVLYNLRVGPAFMTSLALVFSLFFIAVMELCLRTGLFPSCSDYLQAFDELPLDVKLRSRDAGLVRQTKAAATDGPEPFEAALAALGRQPAPASFRMEGRPDEAFRAYEVLGGVAVVTEDLASLNARKHDLERRQATLRQQNALLEQYRAAQTELHRKRSENELFQNIETSLEEAVQTIESLLDGLGPQAGQTLPDEARDRRLTLLKIKLLVSYCKRKGGIVLVERANVDFERSRLSLMINETLSDLRPAGIDCAALIETDDVLPASTIGACCDCLYAFAFAALACVGPTVMLSLQNKGDASVELRIVLEGAQADAVTCARSMERVEGMLDASGAVFSLRRDDDAISLSALMPRRR